MTAVVYLDNAATTRVSAEVAAVVAECMRTDYGNPSSAHHLGVTAEKRVKEARGLVLGAIGDPGGQHGRLIFTSGGTESDALAVLGAARAHRKRPRVLYSAIEHQAVRQSARELSREGFQVAEVAVSRMGVVDIDRVIEALDENTGVLAIMLVNNEIGTLQPIAEIARAAHERYPDLHIHCDAVQALGKLPVDVRALGVDSLALAAHKLHGPKGVGALWLSREAHIVPVWSGGGQEDGLRAGTLNVPGIAGMGEAVRQACSPAGLADRATRWRELADILIQSARASGVAVAINGADAPRAPHILSLAFSGIPAEPLLHVLESRGVLVSAGSACAERNRKPSPVLQAIGLGPDQGTLRLSFGCETTREEVDRAAGILIDAVRDV